MARIKTIEEKDMERAKRRRVRTTTKQDQFISSVVRILKKEKIENVAKSQVKNFIKNYNN